MVYTIVFIAASLGFWAGVTADARSSRGLREKTKIFRDKNQRFSLWRYLLTMAALWGGCLAIVLIGRSTLLTIGTVIVLAVGAVLRFRVAARNRKIQVAQGLK